MIKKKVIFVGGTSFSGSTFLDMMLASGEEGFSAGEVYALFYPYRPGHINPPCCCGDPICSIWQDVKSKGVTNIYEEIFKRFPKVNYIVDSSKNPIWIAKHAKMLKSRGVDVQHVLIFKTPLEFALSRQKRDRIEKWDKAWKNYYRLYFSVIDEWNSVKYYNLATKPAETLENLCKKVGINYFTNKELYWNFTHHTLFGNTSAKVHLYDEATVDYEKIVNISAKGSNTSYEKKHRTIYYNVDADDKLKNKIADIVKMDSKIPLIIDLLEMTKGADDKQRNKIDELKRGLKFQSYMFFLYKTRSLLRKTLGRIYTFRLRNHNT